MSAAGSIVAGRLSHTPIGVDGFIFSTSAGVRPVSGFSKVKARLDGIIAAMTNRGEGVPVASWTLHDLRRTATSGMARIGVPLHVIELILNHQPREISGVARHLQPPWLRP